MLELRVSGMTCEHCVATVGRAVRGVPGVTDVAVDLAHGLVRVEGAQDAVAVRRAIEEEGYEVG